MSCIRPRERLLPLVTRHPTGPPEPRKTARENAYSRLPSRQNCAVCEHPVACGLKAGRGECVQRKGNKMKTLRNKKEGFQVFAEALRRNEDFQNSTGSLSGRSHREVSSYGRLPASWREDLERDKEGIEYVVYSYSNADCMEKARCVDYSRRSLFRHDLPTSGQNSNRHLRPLEPLRFGIPRVPFRNDSR